MRRITVLLDKEYEKCSSIPEGCKIVSTYMEVKSFISEVEEKRIDNFDIFTTSIDLMTLAYDNELYVCYRGVCHQIKPGYIPSNGDTIWHNSCQRILKEKLDNGDFEWMEDTVPEEFRTPSLADRLTDMKDAIHIDEMNDKIGYDFTYLINEDTIDCIGDKDNHTVAGQVLVCYVIAMMYVLKEAEKKAAELYDNENVIIHEYSENGVADLYQFLYEEMNHTPEKYLNKFDRLVSSINLFFKGKIDIDLEYNWQYYAMTKASETGFIQEVFKIYTYTGDDINAFPLNKECHTVNGDPIMCYRMLDWKIKGGPIMSYRMFYWMNDLLGYFLREGIPESIYY